MPKQEKNIQVSLEEGAEFMIGDQRYVVSCGQPIRATQSHARERSYRIVIPDLSIDITLDYWQLDPIYDFLEVELLDISGTIRRIIEDEFKGSVVRWALEWGFFDDLEMNLGSEDVFIQELNPDGSVFSESGGEDE